MRLLISLKGTTRVVHVRTDFQRQETLQDLLGQHGFAVAGKKRVYVDGINMAVTTELKHVTLLEGSYISEEPHQLQQRIPHWNVRVSGGKQTHPAVAIPVHRGLVVGRSPEADLVVPSESASWLHCIIDVEGDGVRVRDAGSTNGTLINGEPVTGDGVWVTGEQTVLMGGSVLRISPELVEPLAPAPTSNTIVFNRPPRPGALPQPLPLEVPQRIPVPPVTSFNMLVAVVLLSLFPVLLAGVLVVSLQNPRFAWLALSGLFLAAIIFVERKRRHTNNVAAEKERFAAALEDFRQQLNTANIQEIRRRQELLPDPALVLRIPELPSTLMWQRRPASPDFLSLHLGVGDKPWQPDLVATGITEPVVADSVNIDPVIEDLLHTNTLKATPIGVDLHHAGVVGIVGERDGALALARSLIIQAAVHCGPADLTVSLMCEPGRQDPWEWLSWLPHTTGVEPEIFRSPTQLLVLDSENLGILQTIRNQQQAHPGKVSGIVVARSADQLPACCTVVVDVGRDASATVHHPRTRTTINEVLIAGISTTAATHCARTLAHFQDPELPGRPHQR